MTFPGVRIYLVAAAIFAFAGMAAGAQAACEDLVAAFDRAVAARSVDAARHAAADLSADIVCGARSDEFQGKLLDFLVTYAGAPGTAAADREHAVALAQRTLENSRNWQMAATLADYFMARGQRVNAHRWYEQSVSFLAANPGISATLAERRTLMTRLAAAKSLANDDQEGRTTIAYVPTTREIDGSLGGIYSKALLRARGAEVVGVPIPINFYTNETRFTPLGEKALQELAQAAQAEQVRTMRLVGHADPRGAAQHNMELSRQRVEAVRDQLLRQGIRAQITIEWKGAQQPFDVGVLPYRPSQEEIWQLDRRVEWVRDALPE